MEPEEQEDSEVHLQVAVHVLADPDPGVPQHLRPRLRAPRPARVARRLPGVHQPHLRLPLHVRDADEDVRPQLQRLHDVPLQQIRLLCGPQLHRGVSPRQERADSSRRSLRAQMYPSPQRIQSYKVIENNRL